VVAERLGHSNPGFTMKVYSHVTPGLQREAADKINEILGGPQSQSW
jgi:integrase